MSPAAKRSGPAASGTSLRVTFLGVALVAIVPFAVVILYLVYAQLGGETGEIQREALSQARTVAGQVDAHLRTRMEALTAAVEAVAAGGSGPGTPEAQVRRLRQAFPDLTQIVIADQVGLAIASTAPATEGRRLVFGEQEWFKRAATSTQPFAGPPRQSGPDALVIGLYAPGRNAEGQLRAVIAADLAVAPVQDLIARAALPDGVVVEVMTDAAIVVARRPALYLMSDARQRPGYVPPPPGQEEAGELVFADGESRLAGVAPIRSVGWVAAVGVPRPARTLGLLTRVGAMTVAVALLALVLAFLIGDRTVKGIARLRTAMGRVETGDLPANLPKGVGGEVGALTESFNRMLGWLHSRVKEYEALSRVEEVTGAAMAGERAVGAVLPDLLRRVVSGMGADAGVVVIQEGETLMTRAGVGFGAVQTEGVELRRGRCFAGEVMGARGAVTVENVETDFRVEEPYLKAASLRSIVGVPIVSHERVIGAMIVGYRASHTFAEGEVQRLETMARRAAQALEHGRALDEVRQNTAGLEARLAEQMEALQKGAAEQAESRRQAQEAQRQTREIERAMKSQAPQVKEIVREDPAAVEAKRVRAAMQRTVSEELRAPLAALLDLPRFLVDGIEKPLGPEERLQLEILHTRGEEILELIDNLVILSGLHAGEVQIAKASVSVRDVVQKVVRALQPRAAARGNRIDVDIKPEVGQVMSDGRHLEEALTNLLATTIKYTEVGEIRVTGFARGSEVVLTVADDGVGFTDEEQGRIFEPFLQLAPRGGRALPGTGLMLTVCQRLVQALGGKIRVESEVDRGTWFTVTLPAGP